MTGMIKDSLLVPGNERAKVGLFNGADVMEWLRISYKRFVS